MFLPRTKAPGGGTDGRTSRSRRDNYSGGIRRGVGNPPLWTAMGVLVPMSRVCEREVTAMSDKYIPALGLKRLTPLYDPLMRWAMPEVMLKTRVVDQAHIEQGDRVLDLGCGTGTLAILVKQICPQSEVVGLDADPKILEIARGKAQKARAGITFDLGMAFELPYPDNAFDHVLSSFVFHHLTTENKSRTFKEVYRILRPGGKLSVLDLGKPYGTYAVLISLVLRRFEETLDNLQGRLPDMIRNAGFYQVNEPERYATIFGVICLCTARKP